MLILDLWGISFHAVIVFGLDKNFLFKSVLGHCEGLPDDCLTATLGHQLVIRVMATAATCRISYARSATEHQLF